MKSAYRKGFWKEACRKAKENVGYAMGIENSFG
jgi:hypothetical protein